MGKTIPILLIVTLGITGYILLKKKSAITRQIDIIDRYDTEHRLNFKDGILIDYQIST